MPEDQPYPTRAATQAAFAEHVSRGKVGLFRSLGLELVMGARQGVFVGDAFGPERWIDCHCNGGVFNLGHRHPEVIDAVRHGLDHVDIGNHHLVSGHRAALAQRLAASTGGHLSGVVFGVGGGEAVDLAIKVVRGVTGRERIISIVGGYHGHTGLALAAGESRYRDAFGANPAGFLQLPFDDVAAIEAAVDSDTAAVIVEPIPATLGMPLPSAGYLAAVRACCTARGAKLIVDEVQTGLGRCGRLWAYQHEGIAPDVLVSGKGLSGGVYPISATLMTRELHAFFDTEPLIHISTFGGSELGCLAALAVLDVVERPGFLERVERVGATLATAFAGLPFRVRRRGLMMGLELGAPDAGIEGAARLYRAGVLCAWAAHDTSVVQFLPPLIIDDDELAELIARVSQALH